MIENLQPILIAAIAGIVYSVIWWSTKNIDPTKPSPAFDVKKMAATAILGALIGAASVILGFPLTEMSLGEQLATMGAVTAVVEQILTTAINYFKNPGSA
jgi:hypothetical protein